MEAGGGPARLDRTLGHRVEDLQRRYQCVRLEVLDLEISCGHLVDPFREPDAGGSDMYEAASVPALHLPADPLLGAGLERGDGSHGPCEAGHCNESCLLLQHGSFSLASMSLPGTPCIAFVVNPGGACAVSARAADRHANRGLARLRLLHHDACRAQDFDSNRGEASRNPRLRLVTISSREAASPPFPIRTPDLVRGRAAPRWRAVASSRHGSSPPADRLKRRRFSTIMPGRLRRSVRARSDSTRTGFE